MKNTDDYNYDDSILQQLRAKQNAHDIIHILRKLTSYNKPTTHSLQQINYRALKLNQCVDIEQRESMLNEYRCDMNSCEFNLLKTTMIYLDKA